MHPPSRRPRADAVRSRDAVLVAAVRLLGRNPESGMAEIAKEAGVTRQTVYAHFGTREVLAAAALDRATADYAAAVDAAGIDEGLAPDALLRLLEVGWSLSASAPRLAEAASAMGAEEDRERHSPIADRIARVVRRGRCEGDFASDQPVEWLTTAVIALAHAAAAEAAADRMPDDDALRTAHATALRVLGAS